MPSVKRSPFLGQSFERHLIGVSSYDDGFKGEFRHFKFSDNYKIEFKPSAENKDPDKFTEECISPGDVIKTVRLTYRTTTGELYGIEFLDREDKVILL
jgi:hypothetical protein